MSSVILYKDSKIIPSKNFVVEGIETYLAGLTKITILDFQYLRNDLNLSIKINKTQDFSESIYDNNYNYLKVVQAGVNYYYFVAKKTQIAQSTIVLELVMDTLNTYPWGTAFSVSPRTRVIREHKDRIKESPLFNATLTGLSLSGSAFEIPANTEFYLEDYDSNRIACRSFTGARIDPYGDINFEFYPTNETDAQTIKNGFIPDTIFVGESYLAFNEGEIEIDTTFKNYERIIDYYSEGITPVLYKEELGQLSDKFDIGWNLIYQNTENEDEAIECLAVPSDNLDFSKPNDSQIDITDLDDQQYYLFAPWKNESITLVDNNGKKWTINRTPITGATANYWNCVQIQRDGSTLYIRKLRWRVSSVDYSGGAYPNQLVGTREIVGSRKTFTTLDFEVEELLYYKSASPYNPSVSGSPVSFTNSNGSFSTSGETTYSFTILEDIDRVNPKLIKIISLPYFTNDYLYSSETMSLEGDNWTFDTIKNYLKLTKLESKFVHTIESTINNPLNVFNIYQISTSPASLRNDLFESKLFHSDFYQPKFVYDSFGFVFELEKIDEEKFNPSEKFTFEFVMTSTINSKFMFKFPEYILKLSTQDYDNILPVSRNNEAPIYNSAYITYLRTAYRYDLKNLYQNTALTKYNLASDTYGAGMNFTAGYMEEDAGKMLSSVWGLVGGTMNAIATLNRNEWQLQAKIESLKNQANSVSGSDDLDLLENYSGNRAKLCLYEVSPRMKSLLADLFYYYGYTTDEIKIPAVNTRYWFNFLSCELEFTGLDKNISDLAKDNLIQRYNAGATFLHEHNSEWDFEQIKENWETSLL